MWSKEERVDVSYSVVDFDVWDTSLESKVLVSKLALCYVHILIKKFYLTENLKLIISVTYSVKLDTTV